jgi:hypothetical protein
MQTSPRYVHRLFSKASFEAYRWRRDSANESARRGDWRFEKRNTFA